MTEIKLQPLDPKLDREATVNDLRSWLDDLAAQGGGSFPITTYYRNDGTIDDWTLFLSDFKIGENEITHKMEVQLRV
jgi:hypothetical protein